MQSLHALHDHIAEERMYADFMDYQKAEQIELLERRGYYLPPHNDQWLTKKLLWQIYTGTTWCLLYTNLR